MEFRSTKTDVSECDSEGGLPVSAIARPSLAESVDAMTRAMQRGAAQPRTAMVGA
jgi:hypothetical protein